MHAPDDRANTASLAAAALRATREDAARFRAVIGFDAMVDAIVRAVDTRESADRFTPMRRIEQFAQRIAAAAGRSINVELAVEQEKVGGNGAIMADALARVGARVTFIGNAGADAPHPVFEDFAQRCARVVTLGEPGKTDAAEFDDGKVMLGRTAALARIRWSAVLERAGGADALAQLLDGAALLAPVSWTMVPFLEEIWDGLSRDTLPRIERARRPGVFIDLADPAKRPPEDLRRALERLRAFEALTPVALGLNLAESVRVCRALGKPEPRTLAEGARTVRDALDLDCVATHAQTGAACATRDGEYATFDGPYTRTPRISTGAGDHFNAGFALAWRLGLEPAHRLACAGALSGWYVRHARGPNFDELASFLDALPAPESQ